MLVGRGCQNAADIDCCRNRQREAAPGSLCLRGASLRREPRAGNEQPMQLAVFHGRLRHDAEDGPFVESFRVDVMRRVERSIGDLARDDFLLIQNLNPACAVAAERETIIRNRDGSLTRLTTDNEGNHHWVHQTGGGGQAGRGRGSHREMVRELLAGGGRICRDSDCNKIRRRQNQLVGRIRAEGVIRRC